MPLLQIGPDVQKVEPCLFTSHPVLQRYELKYTIPFDMIESISNFIKPYCSPDFYSIHSLDGYYTVNSLYFDSPEYVLLRNKLSEAQNRFNMRIRTYGSDPQVPYFLEIKQKNSDVIHKYRAKLSDSSIRDALETRALAKEKAEACGKDASNTDLFRRLAYTYNAAPKVLVQYRRKAFVSDYDEYARVTFDIELRYMSQLEYSPLPIEDRMVHCDTQTVFDQGCNVILELKCYASYVPLWMIDLIRTFNLRQRGFSKYATCMRQVFKRYSILDTMMISTSQFK